MKIQWDIAEDLRQAMRERTKADEALIKSLLRGWVSELKPEIVRDMRGIILGLTFAGQPLGGSKPFILRPTFPPEATT
jgi:hypothetical protein